MKVCPQCTQRYPHESSFCFVDGSSLEELPDPRLGSTVGGRYLLESVIGEGGMATVYRGVHLVASRPYAIKVLNGEVARDEIVRERFRREARHVNRLSHPNIVEISDQGETDDGTPFLVMELLVGRSLASYVSEAKLPPRRVLELGAQMLRALARAHDFEVIHRDLKPENVFVLSGDRIKLLDFGIARSMLDSRLTNVGEIFGTPEYMAPEQGNASEVGPAADIYALGIMFFEMLTGFLPYEAANPPTVLLKHMTEPTPHLRSRAPEVPEVLDELVFEMMEKNPLDRPADAHAVLARVEAIAAELGVTLPGLPDATPIAPAPAVRSAESIWQRRAAIFDQMFKRAYGETPSPDAVRQLEDVRSYVRELETLKASASIEQERLEVIELEGRDGRSRFGDAMDTLSVDASRIRAQIRELKGRAQSNPEDDGPFIERMKLAHREAVIWEGRSGFREPHEELAKAYRKLADILTEWRGLRAEESAAGAAVGDLESQLSDLEFQTQELRSGLENFTQDLELRRDETRQQIAGMGRRAVEIEGELLFASTRFCAPLRAKPELVPLFRHLEAIQ